MTQLREVIVAIKGAGEMASAVAWRLFMANLQKIVMLEIEKPLAVRRAVSFCEAIHDGHQTVERVGAVQVSESDGIRQAWDFGKIAVAADPKWFLLKELEPDLVVDAILAKRNLGTRMTDARLVIALGPGFRAGRDAHMVIETNRGHNLGRVITDGPAEPDTGIPATIGGFAEERVLRSPIRGNFIAQRAIGDRVAAGEVVGSVQRTDVCSNIGGVIRGIIRSNTPVAKGLKIGDIDPRGQAAYCYTISDKARAIGGAVLEAVLRVYNV
jgi:xanthine dehydrogenase accessory factor